MASITDAGVLQKELDGFGLMGCRILSFDVVGRLEYLDHQSMLDFYNNCIAEEGGPYRKPGDPIFEEEIPLRQKRIRMVSTEGPCIMRLDDERILGIRISGFSEASVTVSTGKDIEKNLDVDANKVMSPIIGERISAINIGELPEDAYERQYLVNASNPFKYIRIDCEEHSLYFSYLTCAVLNNVEGLDPLDMTMGELKSAVSYYSDLFD